MKLIRLKEGRREVFFLNNGMYSRVYRDKEDNVYAITDPEDLSKEILCEISGLHPNLPKIEKVGSQRFDPGRKDWPIYRMPLYHEISYSEFQSLIADKKFQKAKEEVRDLISSHAPADYDVEDDVCSFNVMRDDDGNFIFTDGFVVRK